MSNFLIIVATEPSEAAELFSLGLRQARQLKNQSPDSTIETGWARAATFARQNGSGSAIATDDATGSWLLAAGTWFHSHGLASGDEAQLLTRAIEIGADNLAKELEGFFVIAFGDGQMREVSIITDIIGSHHCFVRGIGDCTILSSSSLLLAGLSGATIDPMACEEFLRTGVIYEDRTFFREVCKLAPASVLRFARGKLIGSRRYWQMASLDPEALDGNQATKHLIENLIRAAAKIGKLFTHPVCDLTGGYDSRAVVASFLAAGVDFETTVAGAADSADVVIAEALSEITGKPHRHYESEPAANFDQLQSALRLTDGEYDLVDYARIGRLHSLLSRKFDASINGSFGELARGYWWELLSSPIGKRELLDARKIAARRYAVEPDSPQLFSPESKLNLPEHLADVIKHANAELEDWPNTAQMDNAYLYLRMKHWQGRIASSTDQIWPCLSPFMLRSVLEVMLQTRAQWRQNSLLARMVMAQLNPKLAAHSLESGHPALPLTWRTWPRFAPAALVYARKAWAKASRQFERQFGLRQPAALREPPRMRLWQDEQVRELLRVETMRLNELLEQQRLRAFLAASQQSHFAFDGQWQRLLSLEMTLRFLT